MSDIPGNKVVDSFIATNRIDDILRLAVPNFVNCVDPNEVTFELLKNCNGRPDEKLDNNHNDLDSIFCREVRSDSSRNLRQRPKESFIRDWIRDCEKAQSSNEMPSTSCNLPLWSVEENDFSLNAFYETSGLLSDSLLRKDTEPSLTERNPHDIDCHKRSLYEGSYKMANFDPRLEFVPTNDLNYKRNRKIETLHVNIIGSGEPNETALTWTDRRLPPRNNEWNNENFFASASFSKKDTSYEKIDPEFFSNMDNHVKFLNINKTLPLKIQGFDERAITEPEISCEKSRPKPYTQKQLDDIVKDFDYSKMDEILARIGSKPASVNPRINGDNIDDFIDEIILKHLATKPRNSQNINQYLDAEAADRNGKRFTSITERMASLLVKDSKPVNSGDSKSEETNVPEQPASEVSPLAKLFSQLKLN